MPYISARDSNPEGRQRLYPVIDSKIRSKRRHRR
jgi:hypothetical protein